jgi:hypothetical protein
VSSMPHSFANGLPKLSVAGRGEKARRTAGVTGSEISQSKPTAKTRFKVGQSVRLNRGFPYRDAAGGDYKVLCELPSRDGEVQYRIKSSGEPYERVVKEGDLDHV